MGSATPRRNRRRPDVPGVADLPQSPVTSIAINVAEARGHSPYLFLEATQRKTECTVVAILRCEPDGAEVQIVGIAARCGRRPAVSAVADATQCPKTFIISAVAIARGRCRSTLEPGLSGEKNALSPRALEILLFQLIVETEEFPLKAWRAGFLAAFCDANPAKAPLGQSPAGISIDFAYAKRLKSLLMRAGDRCRSATS